MMDPRESDPTGAFTSGGGAGLEDEVAPDSTRPVDAAHSRAPGVDEAERQTISSGTAATSEVADRDAQDDAEGHGTARRSRAEDAIRNPTRPRNPGC